nr:basic proline-rich protein-like [Dasypus novemcinctus]
MRATRPLGLRFCPKQLLEAAGFVLSDGGPRNLETLLTFAPSRNDFDIAIFPFQGFSGMFQVLMGPLSFGDEYWGERALQGSPTWRLRNCSSLRPPAESPTSRLAGPVPAVPLPETPKPVTRTAGPPLPPGRTPAPLPAEPCRARGGEWAVGSLCPPPHPTPPRAAGAAPPPPPPRPPQPGLAGPPARRPRALAAPSPPLRRSPPPPRPGLQPGF